MENINNTQNKLTTYEMQDVLDLKYVGYDAGDALREGIINEQQYRYYNDVDLVTKADEEYIMNNQEKFLEESPKDFDKKV